MTRKVNVVVHRQQFGATYTIGELHVNGRRIGCTLEYPWRHNTSWDDKKKIGDNFRDTSSVAAGVYRATLRGDHRSGAGAVQWRLELMGTAGRDAIEFHVGNSLVHDSKGCILCGDAVNHPNGVEPRLTWGSNMAVSRFVSAILGDVSGIRNETQWAAMIRDLEITVRIGGWPQVPIEEARP